MTNIKNYSQWKKKLRVTISTYADSELKVLASDLREGKPLVIYVLSWNLGWCVLHVAAMVLWNWTC